MPCDKPPKPMQPAPPAAPRPTKQHIDNGHKNVRNPKNHAQKLRHG